MRSPRSIKMLAIGALVTAGVAAGAGVASAHVTVHPSTADAGSYSVLTFRVPTESDTAGTVGLTIHLPTDHPLASVRYQPVPGWTAKAEKTTLDQPVTEGNIEITEPVTTVTFTADEGTRVGPGEFAEFNLSVGPLPDVDQLSFPVEQSYDDGSVVKWDDPIPADGSEPEHPAPTLAIGAGTTADGGHQHSAGTASVDQAAAAAGGSTADDTARILAVAAVVVAALALLLAGIGLRRPAGRRRPGRGDET